MLNNMKMIDAHAHLHDKKYDNDREDVIKRIFTGEIEKVINVGTSVWESRDAVNLANKYENIYATVGLHPDLFKDDSDAGNELETYLGADLPATVRRERLENAISELEEIIENNSKVVAIGEVGLDYFFRENNSEITQTQRQWQIEAFRYQIDLARKSNLPVVIHAREGNQKSTYSVYEDCFSIAKEFDDIKFVMHCYGGNLKQTKKFLELKNMSLSFAGNITYNKDSDAEINKVIDIVPIERIMIETDSPYLTPIPHRGKRNEPIYVEYILNYIAEIKNISIEKVKNMTTGNARAFYGIGQRCEKCKRAI